MFRVEADGVFQQIASSERVIIVELNQTFRVKASCVWIRGNRRRYLASMISSNIAHAEFLPQPGATPRNQVGKFRFGAIAPNHPDRFSFSGILQLQVDSDF